MKREADVTDVHVSEATVLRRLRKCGIRAGVAVKKEHLTDVAERLQFALAYAGKNQGMVAKCHLLRRKVVWLNNFNPNKYLLRNFKI